MSSNIRRDSSGSIHLRVTNSFSFSLLGLRPLKLASLALKTASIKNLWEVELKQRLVGLSQLHPTLPKRLLAATYILATYNEVTYEQQTHFRSPLLFIFRRERSDDRKCVCCPQANNKVTPKTKKSAICRKLPQN